MLLSNLNLLATAPGGVARLRELILTLAVQGKLVAQDAGDEPASELLKQIRAEKDRLIAAGKIKKDKPLAAIAEGEMPFELPVGWAWVQMGDLVNASEAGWSPTCIGSPRRKGHWGVLKVSAVSWGRFDALANKELPADLLPRPEYEVRDGDFLLSRANTEGLVARSVLVGKAEPKLMLSDKIIRLAVSSRMNRSFLNLCNNASYSRTHYASNASGTSSSMKNVSREVVLQTPVPLPPLAEQSRIVTRVEELMRLCDALEAKGRLEAAQHAQLVSTLLGTLTESDTPAQLAENWQRLATHFDLLLDRPQAVDALEQTILQLAVRGLLVPQDPTDEPASALLKKIRQEKDRLIAAGQIKRDKPLAAIGEEEQPFGLPVGWEWVSLGLLTSLVTSGSRSWKDFYSADGATFIRSQDIKYDRLEFDDRAFVKLPARTEGVRTQVRSHDLLITITGANVGKAAVVVQSIPEAYVSQHVALVRLLDSRFVGYLHLWLVSEHEGRKLLLMSSYGAKPGLNLQNINDLLVPLPPLPEQSRIVTRVTQLRRLCADLRQRLAASLSTQAQLAEALVENVA